MGLTLVTPPTADPVTLSEAKAHCRVSDAEEDGVLVGYILAARMFAENYMRRAFVTQTWDYTIDSDWPHAVDRNLPYTCDRIVLPKPPVQNVMSVSYIDLAGATQTLATDQYNVMRLNDKVAEAYIEPAYLKIWPPVQRRSETITVRFTAGYTGTNVFPEEIRHGMLLLIGHWFANRETVNIGNIVSELPYGTEALFFPYRVFY